MCSCHPTLITSYDEELADKQSHVRIPDPKGHLGADHQSLLLDRMKPDIIARLIENHIEQKECVICFDM
jgi:hypothetical protein